MIPVEVDKPSTRRTQFEETLNNKNLVRELDMINKVRYHAQIQEKACKQRAAWKPESKLKIKEFQDRDLV